MSGGKKTSHSVIIIDDHPSVRFALARLLESLGWTVCFETGSVKEAKIRIFQESWTLAIVDIHLLDGDGLELISFIREAGFTHPILGHSMLADSVIAARVLKAGGNGYLSKVNENAELEVALTRIASGRRYVSPQLAEEMASQLAGEVGSSLHDSLSKREYQVMCLFAEGKSPGQVALVLGCNVNTISTYRHRILKKLNLKSSMDIVRYALRRKLVTL